MKRATACQISTVKAHPINDDGPSSSAHCHRRGRTRNNVFLQRNGKSVLYITPDDEAVVGWPSTRRALSLLAVPWDGMDGNALLRTDNQLIKCIECTLLSVVVNSNWLS